MNNIDIQNFKQIRNLKESSRIEFKTISDKLGSSFWETYSAFGNTQGGLIILGVKEGKTENEILGVNNPDKIAKDIVTGANNKDLVNKNILRSDDIKFITEEDKTVIVVTIPKVEYRDKPIYLRGKIATTYKRLHESDQLCNINEINAMIRDSSVSALDRKILENYDINDLDVITVEKYRLRMKEVSPESHFNKIGSLEEFLKSIGILLKNRATGNFELTLGGLLMFGKTTSIKSYLPHFHLEYIDKSDSSVDRWVDRIIYDGTWGEENLYNFYNIVITKLEAIIKTPFKLMEDGVTRDDSNDFKVAIREVLLNTLIHADYEFPVGVIISKLENEYVFENPGLLRLTPEEILTEKLYSDPRNPLIMDLFRFIKLSERAGSGIKTILQTVNGLGLQNPTIEVSQNRIKFTLPDTLILDNAHLNKNEKIILAFILEHGEIKNKDVQDLLNLKRTAALNALNLLLEKNFIMQIGKGRGNKYLLKK
ncbi:MAG: RNA-binding domain-containing protein [Cetobacterium sp.]